MSPTSWPDFARIADSAWSTVLSANKLTAYILSDSECGTSSYPDLTPAAGSICGCWHTLHQSTQKRTYRMLGVKCENMLDGAGHLKDRFPSPCAAAPRLSRSHKRFAPAATCRKGYHTTYELICRCRRHSWVLFRKCHCVRRSWPWTAWPRSPSADFAGVAMVDEGGTNNVINGGIFLNWVIQGRTVKVNLPPQITPALSGLPSPSPAFTGRDADLEAVLCRLNPKMTDAGAQISGRGGLLGVKSPGSR